MKKQALIYAMALVLTLGGCTNRDTTPERLPDTSTMEPEDNTTLRPEEDILGDGETPDRDMGVDQEDLPHMDDDLDLGVPYDEMVENGLVHDTDGDLTDGENSNHQP